MSITFKKLIGKYEDYSNCGVHFENSNFPKPEYKDAEVYLTSFSGGVERGRCIQLGLVNNNYVQLTEESVIELRNALNDWLDEKELVDINLEEEN